MLVLLGTMLTNVLLLTNDLSYVPEVSGDNEPCTQLDVKLKEFKYRPVTPSASVPSERDCCVCCCCFIVQPSFH